MKTKAVRLYGKNDLRLEEFELPKIKDDEILAKVVCDSICMSSYKASHEADIHKRVPRDIAQNPVIIGHEFAGELVEVGSKWSGRFKAGDKFSIQPALNYEKGPVGVLSAPGYSYRFIGGDATYVVIPNEVMEQGCLLPFTGEGYYPASLSEPLSCVIGARHANYHITPGSYKHDMEIKQGGNMAILAGVGAGLYPSVQEACDVMIQTNQPQNPIAENVPQYESFYQVYKSLYPALKENFKLLVKAE